MALITCPECGKQISDKAEHCIGCGYPLKYLMIQKEEVCEDQADTRTELEKLVDEIYSRNDNMYVAMKELMQITGMDLRNADDIMRKKYKGVTKKEENAIFKMRSKRALRDFFEVEPLRGANMARCPKCGSISISYQEREDGKGYAVCLKCGEKWNF